MNGLVTLRFTTVFVIFSLIGMAVLTVQEIRAQLPDNDAVAKDTQELMKKICQDNPFRSHEIAPIVIPGITGKNGGIAIYGNANATEHGQNGPISIGGTYKDRSSASPYNANLVTRGGNGGIALCGTANGENATHGN